MYTFIKNFSKHFRKFPGSYCICTYHLATYFYIKKVDYSLEWMKPAMSGFKRCTLWFFAMFLLQFSSVTQSCPILCNTKDCSTPGFPVHHQLLELTQTHVHRVSDAIQLPHPLLPSSPPDLNISQQQVAIVLELQYQWISRVDFL